MYNNFPPPPNYNPNYNCTQPYWNNDSEFFKIDQEITTQVNFIKKTYQTSPCYCQFLLVIAYLNSIQQYLKYQQSNLYISSDIVYADILSCSLDEILNQLTKLAHKIIQLGNLSSSQTIFFYFSTNQTIKYIYNYQNVPSNFNFTTLEPLSQNIASFQINRIKSNFFAIQSGISGIAFENAFPYYYTVWQKWKSESPKQNVFIESGVLFPLCSASSTSISNFSPCFDNPFLNYIVMYNEPPVILVDFTPINSNPCTIVSSSERIIYEAIMDGNDSFSKGNPIGVAYYNIQLFSQNPSGSPIGFCSDQQNLIPVSINSFPIPLTSPNTAFQGQYTSLQIFSLRGYTWSVYKSGELQQVLGSSYENNAGPYFDPVTSIQYASTYYPNNIQYANIVSSVIDAVIRYDPVTQTSIQFQNVGTQYKVVNNFTTTVYQLDFLKAISSNIIE